MHVGTRLIRRPEVLTLRGQSSSCLDRDIAGGLFPPPVKLSPDPVRRAVGWPLHEVEAVNRAVIAGESAEAVRELIADLIVSRGCKAAA